MKVPYSKIFALAFFPFLLTVRAVPMQQTHAVALQRSSALDNTGEHVGVMANSQKVVDLVRPPVYKTNSANKRGVPIPIAIMQGNAGKTKPFPVENYETDVSDLVGDGQGPAGGQQ